MPVSSKSSRTSVIEVHVLVKIGENQKYEYHEFASEKIVSRHESQGKFLKSILRPRRAFPAAKKFVFPNSFTSDRLKANDNKICFIGGTNRTS